MTDAPLAALEARLQRLEDELAVARLLAAHGRALDGQREHEVPPSDRLAIGELMHRYAIGIDQLRPGVLATCFTDQVQVDYSDVTGAPVIVADRGSYVAGMMHLMSGWESTQHIMSNHLVSSGSEAGAATSTTYVQAMHAIGGRTWGVNGWYTCEVVSDGSRWRIRTLRLDGALELGDRSIRKLRDQRLDEGLGRATAAEG